MLIGRHMDSSLFMDTQVGVGECDLLLELDPPILEKKRRTSIRRTFLSLLLSANHTHTYTQTNTQLIAQTSTKLEPFI